VEGSEAGTMDGKAPIERVLGSSCDALSPCQSAAGAQAAPAETLRARLTATIVEVLAQGSHPRLDRTAHARAAA
jgi:hypothetical protein